MSANAVKRLSEEQLDDLLADAYVALAVKSNPTVMQCLDKRIQELEKVVKGQIKRYYRRKRARCNGVVAIKAVAHEPARACYYIIRDRVPFDVNKAFA